MEDLDEKWGARYPAMIRLWRNARAKFVPFLAYDLQIRRVLCSTNVIESLNTRFRRAIRARGHFPNEQSALKTLYLVMRSLGPKGHRSDTMGHALEANAERVHHHLHRPHANGPQPLKQKPPPTPKTRQSRGRNMQVLESQPYS